MDGCAAALFAVLGLLALFLAALIIGVPIFVDEEIATPAGVVVEVNETEYIDPNGVTYGGNTTVVVMDRFQLFLASLGGLQCGFIIVVWAVMAIAMAASLGGLSK